MMVGRTKSTNSLLAPLASGHLHGFTVVAMAQTAGRGQRGNSWESEPNKNLTFSMLLRPHGLSAAEQFCLSEAVSLAIVDVLSAILEPYGKRALIKWPNDIYVDDKKICGILIENTLTGRLIDRSIVGIGINVNQTVFRSDAPNPTSLALISGGRRFVLESILGHLRALILENCEEITTPEERHSIHARYMLSVWRKEGFHPYRLPDGTEFMGAITDIAPTGHLTLSTPDGHSATFAFKEVAAVI